MLAWDRKDIRRSMSEYTVRDGDDVYNAPYRATQADLNVFVIDADPRALQTLVDDQLNRCVEFPSLLGSQQGLRFSCSEPWIVVIYASFRSLASADETDSRRGFLRAFELSFWVPITKSQDTAGLVTSQPAWFLPLLYTAPTAAAVTGREVYGYPKVPAYLETAPDGGPPVGVRINQPLPSSATATPGRATATPPTAKSMLFRLTGRDGVAHLPDGSRSGRRISLGEHPLLATIVNRYISNLPLIFRKQVRLLAQGDQLCAAYTALVEARVPITMLQSLEELDPASSRITLLPPDVRTALGIVNEGPLASVAIRQCTLDIQEGNEIWVADGHAPYIAPLAAPGNDLFDEADAFDISPAKATPVGAHVVPQVCRGVAEAYFCRAQMSAIKAILAHDFPERLDRPRFEPERLERPQFALERLGRPQFDPARNFILLMFLRGEKDAGVDLYEFGVWVPIAYQECDRRGVPNGEKKSGWYVPYLFRSPGAAVVQAREWFGHPCQEGFITFGDPTSPEPSPVRSVEIQRPVARGTLGTEWMKQPAITLDPSAAFSASSSEPDGLPKTADDVKAMLGSQDLIALLQVRHVVDTRKACVQEIVRSKIRLQAQVSPRPLYYKVKLRTQTGLGNLLDIDGPHQTVRGFRLEQLSAVWTPPALERSGP
jgi:hypothetical protein